MSPMIVLPPSAGVTGALRWEWVDPEGVIRDLSYETSPTLFVSRGAAGLGSPPVDLVLEKLPNTAGSIVRRANTRPLEIELPISAQATSFGSLMSVVEELRDWFDTGNERDRNPGYLRITRPHDDAVRQVACYYAGGLEGDLNTGAPTWAPLVVSLVAPDPYWTPTVPEERTYGPADMLDPLTILQDGDFDAYPIWTIGGPAHTIVLSHQTSGKAIVVNANGGLTLLTGETLTIDTRPANQRTTLPVIDGNGVSRFDRVAAGSALFWLPPGVNHFTVYAEGVSGNTTFHLAWLPRYRGVLR